MKRATHTANHPPIELRLQGAELEPFRQAWLAHRRPDDRANMLLASAESYAAIDQSLLPHFVRQRLDVIPDIIALIGDADWQANDNTRTDLLAALRYFVDPNDLIPDERPRYGLLDDALVIDIALGEQRHEWLAWREYDAFRRQLRAHGDTQPLSRSEWMKARRDLLNAQMQRRRAASYVSNGRSDRFHRERHSYVGGSDGRKETFGVH